MGHFAEVLGGATTEIGWVPSSAAVSSARAIVAVRPYVDDAVGTLMTRARRRRALRIADFDDLLFAGDPREWPAVSNGSMSDSACAAQIARSRAGLAMFDAFTVSTEPLRAELVALAPHAIVTVAPNGLSRAWVRQGRALHRPWQAGDPRIIRFLSGTRTHDADFATIVPVLREFLTRRADVTVELVGPIAASSSGFPPGRVRFRPRVPFMELPALLASSWVTLAPLETTRFNVCKSAIKFLEAGAFEAPCIATPTWDMTRHEDGGVYLARDAADWLAALDSLYDDAARARAGRRSRAWVDRHGYADVGAKAIEALVHA